MEAPDLILLDPHEAQIRSLLKIGAGSERSAYMLFGIADIEVDPWTLQQRRRLISHRFQAISGNDVVSASARHVTWQTDGFMRLLNDAKVNGLVPSLVHTHPTGQAKFSEQDDRNEAELARTALLKGMPGLISIVIAGNGDIVARIWTQTEEAEDKGEEDDQWGQAHPSPHDPRLGEAPDADVDREVEEGDPESGSHAFEHQGDQDGWDGGNDRSQGWNVIEHEGDEPKDDRIGKAEHPASDSGDQAGGSAGEGLHHEIPLEIAQDVSPAFKRVFTGTLAGDHPDLGGYRRDLHQNEDHGQKHEDRVLEQPDERVQGALDVGKEDIQIGELADLGDTDHRRFTGRFLDGRRCFRRSGRSV